MKSTKDVLTKAQLAELRKALDAKRDELAAKLRRRDHDAPEREADPMDAATDTTIESEMLGVSAHEQRLRAEIEHALARMAQGSYGTSEESGEPIGFARLRIVPWARLTVQEEEQREARAR